MLDFKNMLTLKQTRNYLLSSTDKCLFEDYEINGELISIEQKDEIKAYRKALKDLPENTGDCKDINNLQWPEAPLWFKG